MALIEEREDLEGGNVAVSLPGVKKGDMVARNLKPEVIELILIMYQSIFVNFLDSSVFFAIFADW